MGALKRVAPIFAVRDLAASLAYYRQLGFKVREYEGGGYGFVAHGAVEIHVGVHPESDPRLVPSSAYVWVDDADQIADSWRRAGGNVHAPEDTPWGQHEGVLTDPDSNVIRFGSPMPRPRHSH